MKVTALEQAIQSFVKAFNNNTQMTNRALAIGDAHSWVLSAIVADLAMGNQKMNDKNELDFHYYYQKHEEFVKSVMEARAKEEANKPGKTEEFGGDYGSNTEGNSDTEGQQDACCSEDLGGGGTASDEVPEVPQVTSPQ